MACGACAKRRAARQAAQEALAQGAGSGDWVLTMPDGTQTRHDSRLEARAANAERGGAGTIRRVAR